MTMISLYSNNDSTTTAEVVYTEAIDFLCRTVGCPAPERNNTITSTADHCSSTMCASSPSPMVISAPPLIPESERIIRSQDTTAVHNNNTKGATRNSTPRKTVRFSPYETLTKESSTSYILTEQDIETLWWTQEEYMKFRHHSTRLAARHAGNAIPKLQKVYGSKAVRCSSAGEEEDYDSDNSRTDNNYYFNPATAADGNDDVEGDTAASIHKQLLSLSFASCRGLESKTLRAIAKNRQSTIRAVIWTYRRLPTDFDEQQQQEALASISRSMSEQSRAIATAFGCADEVVAQLIHHNQWPTTANNKKLKRLRQGGSI